MEPKPEKHLHIYKRHKNKKVYFCIQPECFHKVQKDFLENKLAQCPGCGLPFQLTKYDLKTALPKCERCRNEGGTDFKKAMSHVTQILEAERKVNAEEERKE